MKRYLKSPSQNDENTLDKNTASRRRSVQIDAAHR